MSSFPPKIVTKIPPLAQQPFIFQSEGRVLICKEASINIWRLPTSDTEYVNKNKRIIITAPWNRA